MRTTRTARLWMAAAALVALAVLVVAAGVAALFVRRPGPDGLARRPDPGPVATADPMPTSAVTISSVEADPEGLGPVLVNITVDPPSGAEEVQVSTDPLFGDAAWAPVGGDHRIRALGEGYQVVFARFRNQAGPVGTVAMAGVSVDATQEAAVASADGLHRASWVRPLSPTELVVRVEAGRLVPGALEAYDLDDPPDGDRVTWGLLGPRMVHRDGEPYAFPVSERTDVVRRIDRLDGRPLDGQATAAEPWSVTVKEGAGGAGATPVDVTVLSRPTAGGVNGGGDPFATVVHDFVVTLDQPLVAGRSYRLTPPEDRIEPIAFTFDPLTTRSAAIRVNQAGYGAAEPKRAYLAGWFDGIGAEAANAGTVFQVVDAATGTIVAEGPVVARPRGQDLGREDLTGTDVAELDFSTVDQPGRYRICVAAVGCSAEVVIEANPWRALTATVARSTYHQRSGVALGPPYTTFTRPRPYHPDDGLSVEATGHTMLAATAEPETRFADLVAAATGEVVPDAWGGHFDAGDWDRRIQHLWYTRNAAQLVAAFPGAFAEDLHLPESGDVVPDVLDEGLWSLDFYRRMQRPDGAIRGGVESSEHPPGQSASWVDDLAVYAFEPDPWSSYLYAGVAAEVASALRPYDAGRADDYLDSARLAIAWADGQPVPEADRAGIQAQRNVAAAAMLLATGDRGWHDVFVATADYLGPDDGSGMQCHAHGRCDAAWLYLQADPAVTDPAIRDGLTQRFVSSAERLMAAADSTAYRWTTEDVNVPLVWGLGPGGAPRVSGLLRAFLLSGDQRFRDAAVASAGYGLGANPLGTVLVTGFGRDPVRYPVIVDVQHGGIPTWPGTPVYGHHQLNAIGDDGWVTEFVLGPAGVSPEPATLPFLWQWYDVSTVAFWNEFTVHQSHAEALFAFGVLAATS
ncbi:MAG: cellulase N-terminal Ig-like domain-containing protein [Actinomycetota bacterium]